MPSITGTGSYAPQFTISNQVLAIGQRELINPQWTQDVLGIKTRRYIGKDDTVISMATKAAEQAINNAGLHHNDIGMIIVATATPENTGVSTAVAVQGNLGYTSDTCPAFDINAVCSGFVYGLIMASKFMNIYKHILIIGVDAFSQITDFQNRDCVFFGDAAGAVVLSQGRGQMLAETMGAQAGPGWGIAGGTWVMDTKAVYEAAIKFLPPAIERVLMQANLTIADIDHVIPHQASKSLLQGLAREAGLDFGKFLTTLLTYGNTAGASIPFTLDRHIDKIKQGDKVLFVAIGAGWTWGAAVMEW